ncbi:MAG: phosphate ABC transporter substrate-binding protein PstS [Xanthobacteraceae bacterium]|nr:phosphate ABC transporter substrate-binding protein PstS [Xanthobacteraceae bacterium]
MTIARSAPLAAFVAALWFGLQTAPATAQGANASDAIALRGAGSTFASLLYKKWIEAYRKAAPSVWISYDPVGSGEGIARFIAETVDFAGSDVPLSETEIARVHNGVAMMPTLAGMIVLAYNVPGLSADLKLPRDVYADIFAGAIKRWDDPRIRAANPGQNLPHLDIVVVARLDSSGTTAAFTEHLAAISSTWRERGLGVGKLVQWPAGSMLASGSEGVAARIKISEGAIGYVEYGFPKRLNLPMAVLQNQAGEFVAPDAASGQRAMATDATSLALLPASAVDPTGHGAYPIVTYSWIAFNRKYADPRKSAAMRDFIDWGLSQGQGAGVDLGYVPLTSGVIALSKQALGAAGL